MLKDFATSIVETLRQRGFQAYLVGGCVRDLLLGREPNDYDVATNQVHFSKSAYLSNGDNEIRGESLRYNVLTQTVLAVEAEQGSERVHIIITPPPKSPPPKSPPPKP